MFGVIFCLFCLFVTVVILYISMNVRGKFDE